MYHEFLMRVLNSSAHRAKEMETLSHRQLVLVAIFVQRLARNVLHDKVGLAFLCATTINQARDVGMIEVGQDLPLRLEARARATRVSSPARTTLIATSFRYWSSAREAR